MSFRPPPGRVARLWSAARRPDVLLRAGMCLFAAVLLWSVTKAWSPPFVYRVGDVLSEDLSVEVPTTDDAPAVGSTVTIRAGAPLSPDDIELLLTDHILAINRLPASHHVMRSLATFGIIFALYALCGYYIFYQDRRLLNDLRRLMTLLVLVVVTAAMACWAWPYPWRAEIVPVLVFGMTCGIAYKRELALLLSASLLIFLGLATGYRLGEFVVLVGATATAILLLGRIRSRSKLIKVGFFTGIGAAVLSLITALLEGQSLGAASWNIASYNGLWAFVAGFFVTGLLPFIESVFGVLTDISLLELGDASHPLLQELVRRAPGTYNHSINVASIAEAAADAIGARRLLVRVGAYFHDIGKMLKPGYFVENQSTEASRHDALVPAMSTLIIIAHVKDGADLARQHHLPEPVIDFIEQHHGTTLVEYFYRRAASQQNETNPNGNGIQEDSFRYPGPKPQTREAAVLMLADAVESAARALVEPTPARIESLVEDIAMKRLLDGQFDECGLTLKQLRIVEDSLIKSLTAVYHGRLKYPDQRTA
ncbi:MAG: HDIG domain-containing protein [Planctomycetia bacterium]|nr:HDIG domain-containing protein [Planctomycetia bacterium]